MKISVIGLGTMGAPMAQNLMDAGHEVTVFNRTASRSKDFQTANPQCATASTPFEAAREAEALLICVSDGPDVEAVMLAEETGAIHGLTAGALVIDCSTVSPTTSKKLAKELTARNIGFIDAPVSGGSEGAIQGTLAIMCGGSEADMQRAMPVLEAIGSTITHVGEVGAGQTAKAVNQIVIAGAYQSLAEGLVLAERMGVDSRSIVKAIAGGAAGSWVLNHRSENIINDEYPLGFRLRLHRKDLGIALEEAAACGARLPSTTLIAVIEDSLIQAGLGDEDVSALARALRIDTKGENETNS